MNELGFTESYLKDWFNESVWEEFVKFMHGQTVAQVEGEITYYYADVSNFCSWIGYKYPET